MVDTAHNGWLIEEGIGEDRAILFDHGEVIAAKVHWLSKMTARTLLMAKIISRAPGSSRGIGTSDQGVEIMLDGLPREASEGSEVRVIITREPMAERGRMKRAAGRYFSDEKPYTLPTNIFADSPRIRRFPARAWEEVWSLAAEGTMGFAGGNLTISPTPAMTLIDIDGFGSPRELALAAVPAIAQAIRQLDLAGSIGIDFPTVEAKADRKTVDAALADALDDWPHEATAMNGFGFVQLVARLDEPSLLHRLELSRSAACARYLLRQAEREEGAGALLLTCHPAVQAHLKEEWLVELRTRTGREVRIEANPALALEASQAQIVSHD
ncbi:MAG: ribonuclease E/G [Erythrobacter sp.]